MKLPTRMVETLEVKELYPSIAEKEALREYRELIGQQARLEAAGPITSEDPDKPTADTVKRTS